MRLFDPVTKRRPSGVKWSVFGVRKASVISSTSGYEANRPGDRAELRRMGWSFTEDRISVVVGSCKLKYGNDVNDLTGSFEV